LQKTSELRLFLFEEKSMSYSRFHKTASFTVAFLFLLLVMHGQSWAGTEADQIQKRVVQAIEIGRQTQKKEDEWAGKKAELMARHRSLKANQDYLEKLKLKTERALSSQKARLAEFERKIRESARIREELQSYLESVAAQLEEFIKKDIPFLLKERDARLASIRGRIRPHRRGLSGYH
jgi:chromosome segregation ATPase